MQRRIVFVSLILAVSVGAMTGALGQSEHGKATSADAVKWGPAPPMVPKGAEIAVLAGDPGKTGPFTLRLKMPAGFKIPAHSHPSYEAVTLISGDFNIGMGDKLDESKAEKLKPGSFINLPAEMNHFAFATADSVVQINSEGPFSINYVNAADDPRNAK